VGIGREVADAYIDVHGDLSKFRRDLAGAEDDVQKAARENADAFSDAWGKRIQKDVNGKWDSILDAMYSDKKVDWDRMVGEFDPRSFDDARKKITEFLRDMRDTTHFGKDEEGGLIDLGPKLDSKKFDEMVGRLHEVLGAMQKQEDQQRRLIDLQQELTEWQEREGRAQGVRDEAEVEAHRENERWMERRRKTMQEAIDMNKAWARTWDGMRKNNAISDMEGDFKRLASAMNFADLKKFSDSFDSLGKARMRIFDVTAAMVEQGRISQERADELHSHFSAFMMDEAAKSKAMKEALDETNRLRKAQDDYNASLSGMARNSHFSKLEGDFRKLAAAMDSNDFSSFAQGAKDIEDMRRGIANTAGEMHRLGRMTDQEYGTILERTETLTHHFQDNDREGRNLFGNLRNGARGFGNAMTRVNNITRGFREHLQGFAGMNVFGDMIRRGLDFVHNLDRISVNVGKNTLKFGTMASVGVSAFAGLVTVAGDLGAIIGGLAVAAPAFLVGTGIGVGVLVAAMKDMKTVLADLKPAFANLQDSISKNFWDVAAGSIRSAVKALMPIFQPKLNATARALGGLVGKLATAFKDIPAAKINGMMDKMNGAIDILGGAMSPLIQAFTTLGEVGSQYFGRFSQWIVDLSNDFNDFIQKSSKNGNLNKWIDNMIDGFKDLGRSVDGAMGIFNALDDAARTAGFGGVKTLADNLQGAAEIMQRPEFQTTLVTYLGAARDLSLKLGRAIQDLGPAFQSLAPTAKVALGKIGDAVSKLIGYIGDIFSNPRFQQGIRDFTTGLDDAIAKLEPAIKPLGDSLGHALTLLGQIVGSVAEVAAAFTVVLGPVLDSMSKKLGTLINPLKDTALNFVRTMEGPLKALDEQFIGPLVDGFRENLLPAINDFIDNFGPFATQVIKDLGPSFQIIVNDVLPEFVRLATELLPVLGGVVSLLAPTLAATLMKIADGFRGMADAIKILKGTLPITELGIFKVTPESVQAQADETRRKIAENMDPANAGNVAWGEIIANLFWGTAPDLFWSQIYNKVGPTQEGIDNYNRTWGKALEGMRQKLVDDWDEIFSGRADRELTDMLIQWFPGQADFLNGIQGWTDDTLASIGRGLDGLPKKLEDDWNDLWSGRADREFADMLIEWFPGQADFINGVQGWTEDVFSGEWFGEAKTNIVNMWNDTWKDGGGADQLDATVNSWLKTNIGDPFVTAVDNFGKAIPEQFKSDVKEWGLVPAIANWFNNDIAPEIGKGFTDGWKNIAEGRWGSSPEGAAKWEGFWKQWNEFWSNDGTVGDINQTVNDWFENSVFRPLREAWDTAWKAVTDWLGSGGGGEESGRSDTNGQEFWLSFWGGFGGMMGDIGAANIDLSNTVTTWLEDHVWKPIKDWVATLDWAQIGADLWDGFITGVTGHDVNAWEKFGQGFTGWVEDMKNFFGIHSPSTLMFDIAADIVNGFLNGFGDFAASVAAKWEEIKTTVTTKFEELRAGAAAKWEEFKTGWSTFWTDTGTTLSTKWEEFKTTVSTKFEELRSGAASAWEGFQTGWSTFWTDAGTTLSTKWEEFKTTVGGKAEEIKGGIEGWAGDVTNGWNGFWGDVGNTLGQKWGEFTDTTSTKAGEIKTNISNFGSDVSRNWSGFWGDVGGTLSSKWQQFTGTVSDKSGVMSGDVSGMGSNMIGYVQNAMAQMWSSLSGSFNQFVSMVMYRVGDIVGWVSGLPGRISGALSGFGTMLWTHGYAILQGLWNGLQAKWNEITTFVGGIAGWIAANKGPLPYDAQLLVPAGEAIMGGLQRGLESKMDPLLNTLHTITALVTDSVTTDLSKSVMYVAGADAAQGLADGLKANRSSVHNALGSLGTFTLPDAQVSVGGAFSAVGRPTADSTAPTRAYTIAEGAVQVHTQAADPWIIAGTVTDALSDAFSTNSRM
jgi:hypothetical protein